jgi:uncharacterized protein (DUF2252 family)
MKKPKPAFPTAKERAAKLNELRNLKMARSSHAYVRGNTSKFYDWLESSQGHAVPQGPAIWICGDCHVGNLGPIANAKGHIDIQIRDLDQTVVGNPAHDLIRLGLSLASAARGFDLPGVTTALMIEKMVEGYELAFTHAVEGTTADVERPESVGAALKNALRRKWKHLARERIADLEPTIPLGQNFWPMEAEEKEEIARMFGEEKVRRLVTSLRSRDDDAKVEVLDAAYWVKGCSSLGNLRYAVLLGIGGKGGELCLVDVKEAIATVAPRSRKAEMPKDNADRVVQGAWHLSPALGDRMVAEHFHERPVFLRELLPQDLKFEIATLTADEAMKVARYLSWIVGKAHARQLDDDARKAWLAELGKNHTKTLEAPSWLWSSVVELTCTHEGAYLEHCRRYAMSKT